MNSPLGRKFSGYRRKAIFILKCEPIEITKSAYFFLLGLFNVKIFWFCLFVCVNINMSSIQIQDFKMITLQESNVALPKYFVPKAFELSSRRAISTNEERFFLFYKKRLKKNI